MLNSVPEYVRYARNWPDTEGGRDVFRVCYGEGRRGICFATRFLDGARNDTRGQDAWNGDVGWATVRLTATKASARH